MTVIEYLNYLIEFLEYLGIPKTLISNFNVMEVIEDNDTLTYDT